MIHIFWKIVYIFLLIAKIISVPVINNQPLVFNLFEGTVKQTEIGCITCTPTVGGNPFDLKIESVSPAAPCGQKCFGLWNKANALAPPNYCFYFIPNQGSKLNYFLVNAYNINIRCRDDTTDVTALVEVRINPNTPPYFTSLFEAGVIRNTKDYVLGDSVFLANGKDADIVGPTSDKDVLTYSMTAVPDDGLFVIGEGDGQVRVVQDMRGVCSVSNPTELLVTVRDNANSVAGPKRISLTFEDVSIAPVVNNINRIINVNELQAIPSTILTFSPTVPAVTYNLVAVPSTYKHHFTLANGNDLTLSKPLNFEDVSFINITIEVQDGFCVGINWLAINIINENDPPVLTVLQHVFIVDEGLITFDPGFVTLDEDNGQFSIYSFTVPNSIFSINPTSGIIKSLGDLNLDILNVDSVEYQLDVQVSDGFTVDIAKIQLTVKEINNNKPIILGASSYSYSRMNCDDVEKLGTMVAFDSDRGINGQFEFIGGSSGPLVVTKDGVIYMSSKPANGGYFVDVNAIDHGLPPLTSNIPVTVSLIVLACPTPTTTPPLISESVPTPLFTGETTPVLPLPNNEMDFFTKSDNIPWLVLAALLALLLLALVLFVIHRLCCAKQLPPFPKSQQVQPPLQQRESNRRHKNKDQSKERSRAKNNDQSKERSRAKSKDTNKEKKKQDEESRKKETEKSKKRNKDRNKNNMPDQKLQPPGPDGYPPQGRLNNHLPPSAPHKAADDARTMTPFKLNNRPPVNDTYKPRTDGNSYEYWRENSDGAISSRQINVSPMN